jgi:hypothetical protein
MKEEFSVFWFVVIEEDERTRRETERKEEKENS